MILMQQACMFSDKKNSVVYTTKALAYNFKISENIMEVFRFGF